MRTAVTVRALPVRIGAPADGAWGPGSMAAMQSYLGAVHDSIPTPPSVSVQRVSARRISSSMLSAEPMPDAGTAASSLRSAMTILRAAEPNSQLQRTADRLEATAAVLDEVVRAGAKAVSERDTALSAMVFRSVRVAEYARLLGERPPATVSATEYDQLEDATVQLLKLTIEVEGLLRLLFPTRSVLHAPPDLSDVAREYGRDALQEQRSARGYSIAAALMAALGVAGLVWGLVRLSASGQAGVPQVFVAHLTVAVVLIASAYASLRIAEQHRRLAQDYVRQQRQLSVLSDYLAPLPPETAGFLRAALVPRMFPRSIDDDDSLRDPVWPTPAEILQSLARPQKHPYGAEPDQADGGTR